MISRNNGIRSTEYGEKRVYYRYHRVESTESTESTESCHVESSRIGSCISAPNYLPVIHPLSSAELNPLARGGSLLDPIRLPGVDCLG